MNWTHSRANVRSVESKGRQFARWETWPMAELRAWRPESLPHIESSAALVRCSPVRGAELAPVEGNIGGAS